MATRTDTGYDPRRGPRDRRLRVGDSEREAVGEILRHQHAEGRLDSEEFQERIDRCLRAKTYADLDALVGDLPGQHTAEPRVGRPWGRRPVPFGLLPLVLVAGIALSGGHLIWLAFPLVFLFVVRPLLWRSFAPGYHAHGRRARYGARTGPH